MKHIFVSYSRQNLTFAERLARDLDDAGFDVWLDVRQIKGGQEWRDAIFAGINQAEIVVVCLSPSAVESEWVRREILMARGQHKFVIPVMVEDAIELMRQYDETAQLLDVQIIDFVGFYERAFPLLLQALPGLEMVTPETDVETLDPATIPNPFKGLEAFQQTDADIFFGREDLITKLLVKLRADRRFIAVVGASGSGKSSLVRAGLIPAIRRGELTESEEWPLVIFTPGSEPTVAMAKRLMPVLGEKVLPNLMAGLERGPDSLHLITAGLLADAPSTSRLVLVVDQFEEAFTRASKTEAEQFLDLLRVAATTSKGQTLVLLTMRADFFDRLSTYPDLAALFEQENMVIATEMTPENLRLSIEGPTAAVGLVYDHGLTDRILEDVREQPGSLPLLQYALKELYERRDGRRLTFEAYEEIGGVRRALAQHAEDTYTEMNAAQQDIMRRVLLRLVEVSETGEATRRRVLRSDLTFRDISDEAVDDVILQLTAPESRLLIASREIAADERSDAEPTVWIEVSHEALIREWELFTEWVAEKEEELRYGSELLKAAQDWQRSDQNQDYLLTGTRLSRAEVWLNTADPSELHRTYIQESITARNRRVKEEERRLEHEYAIEQQVVEQRRRAKNRQRYLAVVVLFLIIVVALLFFVFDERNTAQDNANRAATFAAEAEARASDSNNQATLVAQERDRAEEAEMQARDSAEVAQSIALAVQAQFELEGQFPERAVLLGLEALRRFSYSWQAERLLIQAVVESRPRYIFSGDNDPIIRIVKSPIGTRFAVVRRNGTVQILDASSDKLFELYSAESGVDLSIDWSPDAARIIVAQKNKLYIIDTTTKVVLNTLDYGDLRVIDLGWSPDGNRLLTVGIDTSRGDPSYMLGVLDLENGAETTIPTPANNVLVKAAWSPDGQQIASASNEAIRIWTNDTNDIEPEPLELENSRGMLNLKWSPNGSKLLGSSDKLIRMWDTETGAIIQTWNHSDNVLDLAWSPYGEYFATAGRDGIARIRAVETGNILFSLTGHTDAIVSMVWLPDERQIITGSEDGTVRLWNASPDGSSFAYMGHRDNVIMAVWSPGEDRIVTTGENGSVYIWDAVSGDILLQLFGHNERVNGAAWSPNGNYLAAVGDDNKAYIWDSWTGDEISNAEYNSNVNSIMWSADGSTLVTTNDDPGVFIWDIQTGETHPLLSEGQYSRFVNSAVWSQDGKRLLIASNDGTARIWDVETGQELLRLSGHAGPVNNAIWSFDEQYIATASSDGTVRVWNANTSAQLLIFSGHKDVVNSVAWSPNGKRIVSASDDGTVRMWDLDTEKELLSIPAHSGGVNSVEWSGDGTHILTTGNDRLVKLWRVWQTRDDLIEYASQCCAVRELTVEEQIEFGLLASNEAPAMTPTLLPQVCNTMQPRLLVNNGARATIGLGFDIDLRVAPFSDEEVARQIHPGQMFWVQAGPECVNDIYWWKIEGYDINGFWTGWVRESQNSTYWLEPFDTGPIDCPGAPPPQMTPGERGRITLSPPLPSRVRSGPERTPSNVIGQLQPGEAFTVISGPVCDTENGWSWWLVGNDKIEGWTAEGPLGEYWMEPFGDSSETTLPVTNTPMPTPTPQQ